MPDGGGIGDGAELAQLPERYVGRLFKAARGLHHRELGTMLPAEGSKVDHALSVVGKALIRLRRDPGIEPGPGNIYSTNDLHHGNLPCLCDWKINRLFGRA